MAWRALRGSFYSITVSMSGAESSFMTLLYQNRFMSEIDNSIEELLLLQQIGFACLEDSAQGGPQIPSERNLLASLNLLEIG
jgi:hypothetical protein